MIFKIFCKDRLHVLRGNLDTESFVSCRQIRGESGPGVTMAVYRLGTALSWRIDVSIGIVSGSPTPPPGPGRRIQGVDKDNLFLSWGAGPWLKCLSTACLEYYIEPACVGAALPPYRRRRGERVVSFCLPKS